MLKENILSDLKISSKSVLEHFTVPDDFQNGNTFKGKCMHCGTLISGSYKVTSNFVTHMKRKHRDLYILHSENKEIQPTLTQCIKKSVKYSPSDPKQLEMTNALIMFIAGDLLPLSIVESEEFKNLIEKADTKYQVPSRKHLSSKLLHEKSVEIKNNLITIEQCIILMYIS
ncbi:E3 SUMO-protein ligase ZBED1-like [Mytilus trossulus]|uniref:E3 SUMO-protein ligase ZBED1-like n=1 Tax=Mytilus trossulus TaxID=6551 RepID=UPI0030062639